MPLMRSPEVSLSCPTTSGENETLADICCALLTFPNRLLDKIAKDIMVCEHKTTKRWDGTIGEYKNHLRKKMFSAGAV